MSALPVTTSYQFGPFTADRVAYRLLKAAEPVAISPKLLDLLFHLLDHAGDLVTKEALLDALWPDANVTDNALTQAVSELRQVLGDQRGAPSYIATVARRGYRFVAPVDTASATPVPVPRRTPDEDVRPAPRGIAVLDFANVTGDPETAWLSAGIAETVTGDLRALGDFRTVDRRRVLEAVAVAGTSLQAVARETGATLVVVGSFQRSQARIRITARLVDAARGEALADAKVDGPVEQIFELQDQIVVAFAREMGLTVRQATGSRIGARETTSLDAYHAFTSGWLRLETLEVKELPLASTDFARAIEIDHRYALAHTGLASAQLACYESTRSDNAPDRDLLDQAIDHARHAVALDPGLAEAHAALGFVLVSRWNTTEAVAEARQAVALEPGNWRHHFRLGHAAWGGERLRAAEATLVHHPGFAFSHFQCAMVHVARGDLSKAEQVLLEGGSVQDRQQARRERFPALGLHWLLGMVRLAQGSPTVALDDLARELAVADVSRLYGREYTMHAHLGRGLAWLALDRVPDAVQEFDAALALYPDHAQTHLAVAGAHGRLGDREGRARHLAAADAALDVLERCRPVEAALVGAVRLVVDDDVDSAARVLLQMLADAPPGFSGWTLPIEPLLRAAWSHPAFHPVQQALARRAA